ncbi:MAG: (d)CMP kinase [Alphaproteobacteria bacterium]|nr:MAG: (d)CMP kinase [Alphaproteobacteria bacterium]
MIIAIDGPAASGKGTMARMLADHYDLAHLDTGALYRGVAWQVLQQGGDPADAETALNAAQNLSISGISGPELRTPEVAAAASIVAAMEPVRAAILQVQRDFAHQPKGAVLDGRDIGTVVCPEADVKLFITASVEERARRRHAELVAGGKDVTFEGVLADLQERDARDSSRAVSPLTQAEDAHLLDTTKLSIEAAFKRACDLIETHSQEGVRH